MNDITALMATMKAAAEKATPGEWSVQFGDEVYATDGVENEQIAIATNDARDADFIALANPANVLALVEALEKAQNKATSEPVALRWRWNDNDAQWTYAPASKMPDFVAAGFSPENGVVIESLYTAPPAMESRTVTVKPNDVDRVREEGNQFLVVRHPGKTPVIKHPVGELEDYLLQILKADPLATIDIVTHRYYGAGGQWVEDADEYLAAAGIQVIEGEGQ